MSEPKDDNEVIAAMERLLRVAYSDTGQSKRVADFLLAWWNARENGGFDLTDLWSLDTTLRVDVVRVFAFVAGHQLYPDALGYDLAPLVRQWRKPKRRRG
jgi:hypothetical protein